MKNYKNTADFLIDSMFNYFDVYTMAELAPKLNTTQQTISSWKSRDAVKAIKQKCKDLGIYNEIFEDRETAINNFQNSINTVGQDFSNNNNSSHTQTNSSSDGFKNEIEPNMLKLVNTIYGFAMTNNKIDELKTDLSLLLSKYM